MCTKFTGWWVYDFEVSGGRLWSLTIFETADVRSRQKPAKSCCGVYTGNLDVRINRTCGRPRPAVVVGWGAFALVSRPSWDGAAA